MNNNSNPGSKLSIYAGYQWGSEGKGNFAAALTEEAVDEYDDVYALRVGSINAGHTMTTAEGEQYTTQLVPCSAFTHPGQVTSILGAACLVCFDTLYQELQDLSAIHERMGVELPVVFVDEQMSVVTEEHHEIENEVNLEARIGSTKEGVGAATASRVMRDAPKAKEYFYEVFSEENPEAYNFLLNKLVFVDTVGMIGNISQSDSGHLILEGTQGVLLSLYTSGFYPFCTSRQCDPYSMMGQAGTNSKVWDDTEIFAVCRTHPIRVGGNSGELPGEVTWEYMKDKTDGYIEQPEVTSVTGRNRRIAELDMEYLYRKSFIPHMPDSICLSFLDYVDPDVAGATEWSELSTKVLDFVTQLEEITGVPVKYVSTHPGHDHVIRNPYAGMAIKGEDGPDLDEVFNAPAAA